MKRSIALAALATLASGTALAQSTVTVYGRLNVSVERQKQVTIDTATLDTSEKNITALQNSSSRIGFKGWEDLGGGLKAGFLLEHGFDPDTGKAAATFWGRESWVGLEGGFGKVRLGNMGPTAAYFATADYISMHNHDTGTSADAFYLYPGNVKNTIAYTSPSFAGFQAELQYGLKENGTKNTVVLAGNYDAGPLHLGVGYVDGTEFALASFLALGGVTGVQTEAEQLGIRGLYEFGPFTVGAYYINDKASVVGGGDMKRNSYRVSAMYALGASEFHVNVGKAANLKVNGNTIDNTDATQATIAYNYNLSKRTKVYAFYTKLSGDGADFYSAVIAGSGTTGVKSAVALGIRHNF